MADTQRNDLSLTEYESDLVVDAIEEALYQINRVKHPEVGEALDDGRDLPLSVRLSLNALQSILDRLGEFVYDEDDNPNCRYGTPGCNCTTWGSIAENQAT